MSSYFLLDLTSVNRNIIFKLWSITFVIFVPVSFSWNFPAVFTVHAFKKYLVFCYMPCTHRNLIVALHFCLQLAQCRTYLTEMLHGLLRTEFYQWKSLKVQLFESSEESSIWRKILPPKEAKILHLNIMFFVVYIMSCRTYRIH